MYARLSHISSIEPTSRIAINASKRRYRTCEAWRVVKRCSARIVSWAARPLAVGSRPVEHRTNAEEQSAVCRRQFGRATAESQFSPVRVAWSYRPSGRVQSLVGIACPAVCTTPRASKSSGRAKTNRSVLFAALRRTAAPSYCQGCWRRRVRPRKVASERSGCQNAPCTRRRHLTPPSSGRSKGRFAPFGTPLMSNVRPLNTRPHQASIQCHV